MGVGPGVRKYIFSPEDPVTYELPVGYIMLSKASKKRVLRAQTDLDYHQKKELPLPSGDRYD